MMAQAPISRAGICPWIIQGWSELHHLVISSQLWDRTKRAQAGSWQGWELENQVGDFFQPCTCISHKKVEGREERILIQMLSFSCGLQHIQADMYQLHHQILRTSQGQSFGCR